MRRPVRIVAIALVALVLATGFGARAGAAPRRVTIYGDSLTVEAEPYLARIAAEQKVALTVEAYPGTAPCDYLPVLRADLATRPPDVVVLAFSGNSFVTCMLDASGNPITGAAIVAKYRADVEAAVDAAHVARRPIVLVSPPVARGRESEWRELDAIYRRLAATRPGTHYLDAGGDIAPHGRFTERRACLRVETTLPEASATCRSTRSRIEVRGADGLHFCGDPPAPAPLRCPGYASGARRYAANLVRGAKRVLRGPVR